MELKDLFTPEVKTALTTIGGIAGIDSFFGALSNKYSKYQSLTITTGAKVFRALAVITDGIADLLERAQDFGGKVTIEVKELKIDD